MNASIDLWCRSWSREGKYVLLAVRSVHRKCDSRLKTKVSQEAACAGAAYWITVKAKHLAAATQWQPERRVANSSGL